ncbi:MULTISPECIES: VOC family protein [Pseudomonas]|jgi:catechol 2,3-dioxygenase|uniref:Glyoxalase n=2 Tax=Pseudomonas TaxID=286 RepID=A0A4Y9TC68_PSEFL|nr:MULTISPECIES: VOC family protein [Pseudomonas]CRM93948.1 Biphenyl-2,3-diol 1,2-dioxygenase 2 [Pseudomonas sp. 22 E 5]MCX9151587.1 VOC family protein [Pseudomonas sp. TB1-B1]QXH69522.1 VOC family protein [Pseudomonas asgharzadehiana]TFW40960.1 glyoxalase [Pseudomonas fluorescens]TKJ61207.1 glyoxalase [Pseudomonas sp. CFBP13506]
MKVEILRTHLSLWVSDPDVSARWYADILGMHESARGESWVMMAFGTKHHDIALIRAEPGAHQGGLGLQHYGLEIAGDMTTLRQLYGMLLKKGVEVVKITDHEIGHGLYFNDPDCNRMEFFLETEHDDARGKARFKAAGAPSRNYTLDPLDPI